METGRLGDEVSLRQTLKLVTPNGDWETRLCEPGKLGESRLVLAVLSRVKNLHPALVALRVEKP